MERMPDAQNWMVRSVRRTDSRLNKQDTYYYSMHQIAGSEADQLWHKRTTTSFVLGINKGSSCSQASLGMKFWNN